MSIKPNVDHVQTQYNELGVEGLYLYVHHTPQGDRLAIWHSDGDAFKTVQKFVSLQQDEKRGGLYVGTVEDFANAFEQVKQVLAQQGLYDAGKDQGKAKT